MGNYRLVFISVGIIFSFYACNFPSPVGVDFVGDDPLTVTYFDTVSFKISTMKYDSIPTSNSDRMLIGYHEDERLGEITARTYFLVGRDSLDTYPDEEKAVYDSLSLEMIFDGYSYYDTANLQTYYLYRLLNEMETGDDGLLYNINSFQYETDSTFFLGKISLFPRVRKGEAQYLKINDIFGKTLFDLLRTEDEIVESNSEFHEYVKGFVLVPDSTNTCFLGLNEETNIKLFYTQDGEQVEQIFPVSNNIRFTQMEAQGSDAAIDILSSQKDIAPSDQTGEMAFIQGGVGLGIRVEFPYLDYVRELSDNHLVTDAELVLSPVKGSYSGLSPLSADLSAYKLDKHNNILGEVPVETLLFYDDEYNEETRYVININSFLEEQIDLLEDDGSTLLIALPQSNRAGTINRIYIGDENHENRSYMRLLIMNINDTF